MSVQKKACILMCVLLLVTMTGCGASESEGARSAGSQSSVETVLQQGIAEDAVEDPADTVPVSEAEEIPKAEEDSGPEEIPEEEPIDVDLTILSSTMVYSEVYNMMVSPDSYIGKTIKMSGLYSRFHDESTGKNYDSCIIMDATACCTQGIEFVLTDDYVYPDDYPEEGEEICVIGTFDTYREGEYLYCTLRNARRA